MADAALKFVLKAVGYPAAPYLKRRVPIASKELKGVADKLRNASVLEGMSVKVVSLLNDKESKDHLNDIVLTSGGDVAEDNFEKVDAIVCDVRGVEKIIHLTELHSQLQSLLPKINKSGRVVLLGGDTIHHSKNVGEIATTEAVGGFAKALSQELGGKGITVNALQIPTSVNLTSTSAESGVIQFFLSQRSAFISGQVCCVELFCLS